MTFATNYEISLAVDKGPPPTKQKGSLANVEMSSGQRYVLSKTKPTETVKKPDGEALKFCSIEASRYEFDNCGTPDFGIKIFEAKITGPQVYLNRPGQNLDEFASFEISADPKMFEDEPELLLTVTFGTTK